MAIKPKKTRNILSGAKKRATKLIAPLLLVKYDMRPVENFQRTGNWSLKYKAYISLSVLLAVYLLVYPVLAENISDNPTRWSKTVPKIPLFSDGVWFYQATVQAGYPMVNHAYGPMTEAEMRSYNEVSDQKLRIIPYFNPPLFPNETIYGLHHTGLGYVSWIVEYPDPGDENSTRIMQVADQGEAGEPVYLTNISSAENDYLQRFDWFVLNGKMHPRTWVNGTMHDGQQWSEFWYTFTPDTDGSMFRLRNYTVTKESIPVENQSFDLYILTMEGRSELHPGMHTIERFYMIDGLGFVGRDFTEETYEDYVIPREPGYENAPGVIPKGSTIFGHSAVCTDMVLEGKRYNLSILSDKKM